MSLRGNGQLLIKVKGQPLDNLLTAGWPIAIRGYTLESLSTSIQARPTRQYGRLVDEWVVGIGLRREDYETHSLETVQNVGLVRLLAETAGVPSARRWHGPGRAYRSRRRFALSASNERPSETSASAAEHSFADAAAIAPCSR
jgi:hypothetical protein